MCQQVCTPCAGAVDCYLGGAILDWVVSANGVYDIMCAVGILFLPNVWIFSNLAQLHPTMFTTPENQNHPILRRSLAYWLLTYGSMRIAIVRRDDVVDYLVAMTYFLEAAAFAFEDVVHLTTQRDKVAWVSWSSVLLGIWVILRPLTLYSSPEESVASIWLPITGFVFVCTTGAAIWCVCSPLSKEQRRTLALSSRLRSFPIDLSEEDASELEQEQQLEQQHSLVWHSTSTCQTYWNVKLPPG